MTNVEALVTIAQTLIRLDTGDHAINVTRNLIDRRISDADGLLFLRSDVTDTDSVAARDELRRRYNV